ncbi:MAG: hypothetical protein ACK53Y_16925, partial [bacterium]
MAPGWGGGKRKEINVPSPGGGGVHAPALEVGFHLELHLQVFHRVVEIMSKSCAQSQVSLVDWTYSTSCQYL